ncbi:MAG: TetR/AcrR family transcriptional regulator [Hyphomicrobiales bacterium]
MDQKESNLIEQTAKLFLEYGIRSVTMDDIARNLVVSKKTLYQYFKDKEELLSKVLDFVVELEYKCYNSIIEYHAHPIKILHSVLNLDMKTNNMHSVDNVDYNVLKIQSPTFLFDLKKYYPHLYNKIYNDNIDKGKELYEQIIEGGKDLGVFRDSVDTSATARFILNAYFPFNDSSLLSASDFFSPPFLIAISRFVISGLLNDEGRKYYKEHIGEL